MNTIETICAKIEQRIKYLEVQEKEFLKQDLHTFVEEARIRIRELQYFLSLLDALKEESDNSLEEEIDKRYLQTRVAGYVDGVGEIILSKEAFGRIARHFAQWGAEHLQNRSKNDLL